MTAQSAVRQRGKHRKVADASPAPLRVAATDEQQRTDPLIAPAVSTTRINAQPREERRHDIAQAIVGADSGLRSVMDKVRLVATSDVPVLILGETGTGKEVVVKCIHSQSTRSKGPILRVNCGAIPPELVDSELFGHERGSFTGAEVLRRGWFERADGGTLFLDECGELPLAAQVRLLRILQDGTFMRVGGEELKHVDVRVVAATHRDLQAMIVDRTFRADLWYRLSVFPISLPPLRERTQDISALAKHFAADAAKRFGIAPCELNENDLQLLLSHAWPGNVRELAAVMERAVILGIGKHLDIRTALGNVASQAEMSDRPSFKPRSANGQAIATNDSTPRVLSLDDAMRAHIETVLRSTHGRIDGPFGAATQLHINPHTLRARMRKLGIDRKKFQSSSRS